MYDKNYEDQTKMIRELVKNKLAARISTWFEPSQPEGQAQGEAKFWGSPTSLSYYLNNLN